jgi:hypothetical protein
MDRTVKRGEPGLAHGSFFLLPFHFSFFVSRVLQ